MNLFQRWVNVFIEPGRIFALRHLPRYFADWVRFRRRAGAGVARFGDSFPCLSDNTGKTPFDSHYFYQGAWLARQLAKVKPARHVDVGSSVMMVGVVSGHVPTVFVDYRPLGVRQPGLMSVGADISRLPFADGSIPSLSCLHVIEHIGLGRYGDPLDPEGPRKAASELGRVLQHNGRLYLSTPVGRELTYFNAHRVFAPSTVQSWFPAFHLLSFSYVSDAGTLHGDVPIVQVPDMKYGCGLFVFEK